MILKRILVLTSLITIFIFGCNVTIVSAKWEKADEFLVKPNTHPSDLISLYLGNAQLDSSNNYCLVFFDIYCSFSYQQIKYINTLQRLDTCFKWYAVTIYNEHEERQYRVKKSIPDDYKYDFQTFYSVNGLKSSLRNLYYGNNIQIKDIVPMTLVVRNDTIVNIINGAINSDNLVDNYKNMLDSLCKN